MVFGHLLGILVLTLGWMVLYAGVVQHRTKTMIADTPTSTARAISLGVVELEGRAEPDGEPHEAPFSKDDCVVYRYYVDQFSRDENSSDDWVPIEIGSKTSPFYVNDGTGRVLVDPAEAEIDFRRNTYVFEEGERESDPIQSFLEERSERIEDQESMPTMGNSVSTFMDAQERRFGDAGELIGDQSSKRRYVEEILPVDEEVYVFGYAEARDGVSSPDNPENVVVRKNDQLPTFRISTDSEDEVVRETGSDVWTTLGVGAGVAGFGFLWLLLVSGSTLVGIVLALMISPLSIGLAVLVNRVVDLGRIRVG